MPQQSKHFAVCPLGSGSKGNSWWIEDSETTVLVDCGFSYRELSRRINEIGRNPEQIKHVFITHEHRDHIQALRPLLTKIKPVLWTTRGTLKKLRKSIPDGASVRMMDGKAESAGSFEVRCVPVSHDAAEPVAFRFDSSDGSAAIVTDLGKWDSMIAEALRGAGIAAIESNHDIYMLENGPYPFFLKQRIASIRGHLSNEDGALLALEAIRNGTDKLFLSHISQQNNKPDIALEVFTQRLKINGFEPTLEVASQSRPGPWIEI